MAQINCHCSTISSGSNNDTILRAIAPAIWIIRKLYHSGVSYNILLYSFWKVDFIVQPTFVALKKCHL